MPQFFLSPSRIARFFYHECERYLRYHATPHERRKAARIPSIPRDQSPVTAAILEGGYAWEEEVIRTRLKNLAKIARGKGPIVERAHDIPATLALLPRLKPGEAIYQPTLKAPSSFLNRYGLTSELCDFPPCRPDLVQLVKEEGTPFLRVIDVKASAALKPSHRIQTTLYALILREILEAHGLALPLDTQRAGIWLSQADKPELFDLRLSIVTVERFLKDQLPRILTSPMEDLSWHLFFRCEWCEFYKPCRKEAEDQKSVSLIPYLSVGGRNYLREAARPEDTTINSLSDLDAFLAIRHADTILDACGSLRSRGDRLRNALRALNEEAVVSHGGASLALPVFEQVMIVMTLQSDPITGEIYAAGFRRLKGKEVYGDGLREVAFIADAPDQCKHIQKQFLKSLFQELTVLHGYNQKRAWSDQKSLHAYVFDGYELTLFNRMLQEALSDPTLSQLALQMLFHFQDTTLADADEHPMAEIPFPVIVITGVIRQLLALPIPVSFRLPEVCKVLPSPGFKFSLKPSELFWFELSNTLKSDAIFMAWNRDRNDAVAWVHDEILQRLRAASAVLEGVRERVKDHLFAWPPKFLFPGALDFEHPELSRLAFITRYESLMGAMEVRESRSQPWTQRVREGTSIPLKKQANGWKVLSDVDSSVLDGKGGFHNFLLVPEGDAGERAQMGYNDYTNRRACWSPKSIVRIARFSREPKINPLTGLITHLYLEEKPHKEQEPFETGDKAILHPRFTDFNSDRVLKRLRQLDAEPENDFLQLIKDPGRFAVSSSSKFKDISVKALRIARRTAGFTTSQLRAFKHLLERRLTLVWGPPGTGKTHFLAKAILTLAKAKSQEGEALRVAVTAFTHAAIENLLAEINECSPGFGLGESLTLCKLKHTSTPRGEGIEVLGERELNDNLDSELLIVGGTVFSFNNAKVAGEFPLLIVDEASQMKFDEFALGSLPLAKRGHLVLAGDDLQLPPILKGSYPEPADGRPGLQDSVFAFLRARDVSRSRFTHQLQENWRMNETLSRFPAETLYGLDYKPATPEIRRQKLPLRPTRTRGRKPREVELCDWLLDPEYPMAVAILEDIQATAANVFEAELVALLSVHLRKHLLTDGAETAYPATKAGDRTFWRRGLFIVCPHRAQIRAIKKELSRLRDWRSEVFVDTADKMQGQQSQSVIVSYGVSDVETALAEAEFIYSLNRLNVSLSRARAKCITFLPRPLMEPSFDVLQNEKAVQGLSHMHALVDFCTRHGEERRFALDSAHSGKDVKLTAYRSVFSRATRKRLPK